MGPFLLNSNLQIWNCKAQLTLKCWFQFLSTPMTRRGQLFLFLTESWQTFPNSPGTILYSLVWFFRKIWKIKDQLCYNLHFKKEVRNNYLKTVPHIHYAANSPDFSWVLGRNYFLANHLKYRLSLIPILEFHELFIIWKQRNVEVKLQRTISTCEPQWDSKVHLSARSCCLHWADATYAYRVSSTVLTGFFPFHITGKIKK